MLFSIITVARNNAAGLMRTAQSVRAQSCADYEWVVIDGASTDGTPSWLATLSGVKWISEADAGIYDAMNKGIDRALGDYLLFLNAGDELASTDTLATIRDRLRSGERAPDFIYGDSLEKTSEHKPAIKPARTHKHITTGMFTHHQAMLYRRAHVGDLRYDTRYLIAADYDFTAACLAAARHVLYLPIPLCLFEQGGVSQRRVWKGRAEQFLIRHRARLCPLIKNIALFWLQTIVMTLRQLMPGLYWTLKQKGRQS